jgi:DNA-binding beta-propeller fold protein YncE
MRGWLVVALLGACGGDDAVHHLPDAPIPPAARGIYVTLPGNAIAVYSLDAKGDVAPLRTISGAATGLDLPLGIDVEPVTGDLFVANRRAGTVTVYPAMASGDVAPIKTLTAAGMGSPQGVAFMPTGELFVSTCPGCGQGNGGEIGIWHFPPGSTTSDRRLGGAATQFTNPSSIWLDPDSGELVVGNSFGGNVSSWDPAASGDVAPKRAFSPGAINLQSLAVAGGTVFVTDGSPSKIVQMFATNATGTPTAASLANGGSLNVSYPGGIAVDGSESPPVIYLADFFGNAIHVIRLSGTAPDYTLGTVDVIRGPASGLTMPLGVRLIK